MNTTEYFVLRMFPRFEVTRLIGQTSNGLTVFGLTYLPIDEPTTSAILFYDWLRNTSHSVIGLQLLLPDEWVELVRGEPCNCVDFGDGALRCFFGDDRDVDETTSAGSEFGGMWIMRRGASDWIVVVETDELEDDVRSFLRSACSSSSAN